MEKNQNNFKFNVALSNASVNNVFYPTQYSNEKNYHMSVNFFNFNSIGKFYKDRGKLSPIINRSLMTAVSDKYFYRVKNSSNVESQSEKNVNKWINNRIYRNIFKFYKIF